MTPPLGEDVEQLPVGMQNSITTSETCLTSSCKVKQIYVYPLTP